jgi:hypothetical protein
MTNLPMARQEKILAWLQESPYLTIEDLAIRLNVSAMTIHRDLAALVEAGEVEKVHGGVTLARPKATPPTSPPSATCALCATPVNPRTHTVLQQDEGQCACCPHCGLLMLRQSTRASVLLTRDFLYGRMVNARTAFYVYQSEVSLCCEPSVLAFANQWDAERFQRGFAGQVFPFLTMLALLQETHQQHPNP